MEPLGATTVFLVICVSCLLFLFTWRKTPGNGKLPPGPVAFPLIGNMLQLREKSLPQHIEELSRTYGPMFTIYLGSERVVVLHGYEIVKEALINLREEFSGRGSLPLFKRATKASSIAFANGKQWKQLRRFALRTLRDFGMGKKSIEERIQEETCYMVERFRNTHGWPFDPKLFLTHVFSNIICSIIFGDRFDYEDKNFVTLISLILENGKLQQSPWTALYNFFPTLMDYVPGPHQRLFKIFEELRRFIRETVNMHKACLDPNCPRDFIDAFLIKIEEDQKNGDSVFTEETLVGSTVNLFFAGTETSSITLYFGLLVLLKFPEIQEKVHEEIDRVIGRSRSPSMADRSQMPYTDAVVHEIQRFLALAPIGVPRAVTRDVHLKQYVIPKSIVSLWNSLPEDVEKTRTITGFKKELDKFMEGTTIFPALKSVLYDSREFPNPEQFNPGHFLDKNGAFKKSDFFMPFSAGKRTCLGEDLARMELFLILTAILQNFTLKPVVEPKDVDIIPVTTFVGNVPKPYELRVLYR